MRPYLYPLGALLLLGSWALAPAQNYDERYYEPESRLHAHFDMGYAATTGQIANFLEDGFTIGGGLSWQPDYGSPLALRADLDYTRFQATRQLVDSSQAGNSLLINSGFGESVDLSLDGEYRMPLSPYLTAFAVAGVGGAYRRIALTQTVAVGDYVCDPWFDYCDYGLVAGEAVVASDDTTRFAWNAGLGLEFALARGETFFVEARFTRIQTSPPTDFIPIRVGVRF